jgi:CheY-like chemotaxis protein
MTRRPGTVSGTAGGAGGMGVPAVPTVLLADADVDSCAQIRDALLEGVGPAELRAVATVRELHRCLDAGPRPHLLLIDLDLPDTTTGALDAVRAIKCNAGLRRIPVVVLARNPEPAQVAAAYDAGANTLIPKPVTFLALVKLMKVLTAYWLELAALPE